MPWLWLQAVNPVPFMDIQELYLDSLLCPVRREPGDFECPHHGQSAFEVWIPRIDAAICGQDLLNWADTSLGNVLCGTPVFTRPCARIITYR